MLGGYNMNEYKNSQEYADSMELTAKKILKIIAFVILGAIIVLVFSFSVKLLWNWLIPNIFGFREITYWEGIGLLVLAKILFGGFGSGDSSSKRVGSTKPAQEIKGVVSKAIHDEMQEEFKKEYLNKYGKEATNSNLKVAEVSSSNLQLNESVAESSLDETLSNQEQEELYEEWWDKEGEKLFESFITGQK